jgi:5-(carboxyamino)imidazole ribonucleotide mutase
MTRPLVVIIMGSSSDADHCQKIAEKARALQMDVELYIGSAHKTPAHLLEILAHCEQDPRPKVYITVAGRSNALSGFVDGAVTAPVIASPPPSDNFAGADIYSSLRMPSGIAPALVLEPGNAALLAAKILAISDQTVKKALIDFQKAQVEKILSDNRELQNHAK